MTHYYKPSGKFSAKAFLYMTLVSVTLLPLIGLVYAYAVWYMPMVYINAFLTLGCGLAAGYVTSEIVIKFGNVRNQWQATIFGLFAASVSLYFSWVFWIGLVIDAGNHYGLSYKTFEFIGLTVSNVDFGHVVQLITRPGLLFDIIATINEAGTWALRVRSSGTGAVHGIMLLAVWFTEAGVVLWAGTKVSHMRSIEPFSEEQEKWYTKTDLVASSFITEKDKLRKDIETLNPHAFDALSVADENMPHSSFELYTLDHSRVNYLSISNRALLPKGNLVKFSNDEIIQYIEIDDTLKSALVRKLPAK